MGMSSFTMTFLSKERQPLSKLGREIMDSMVLFNSNTLVHLTSYCRNLKEYQHLQTSQSHNNLTLLNYLPDTLVATSLFLQ